MFVHACTCTQPRGDTPMSSRRIHAWVQVRAPWRTFSTPSWRAFSDMLARFCRPALPHNHPLGVPSQSLWGLLAAPGPAQSCWLLVFISKTREWHCCATLTTAAVSVPPWQYWRLPASAASSVSFTPSSPCIVAWYLNSIAHTQRHPNRRTPGPVSSLLLPWRLFSSVTDVRLMASCVQPFFPGQASAQPGACVLYYDAWSGHAPAANVFV